MPSDKPTKIFLFYAFIVFSILLFSSCSSFNDDTITACTKRINSTYYIESSQSSFPMDIRLNEGESIYFELCDINIELYAVYQNYPAVEQNQSIIRVSYNNLSNVSEVEYNSTVGIKSYYAENETNFVLYFNQIINSNNKSYLDLTVNHYYKL